MIYIFDENSAGMLKVLQACRAAPDGCLLDLPAAGIPPGTLDHDLFAQLGGRPEVALIARDGRMLEPVVQREAWQRTNVSLFLLYDWGQLPLFELGRRILFLWPALTARAVAQPGSAWRVSARIPSVPERAFRSVTGPAKPG